MHAFSIVVLALALFASTATAQDSGLAVTKVLHHQGVLEVGAEAEFLITLLNHGDAAATDVIVLEELPAGLDYRWSTATTGIYTPETGEWTIPALEPGETAELRVSTRFTVPWPVVNCALVVSGNAGGASDCVTVTPADYPLELSEIASR